MRGEPSTVRRLKVTSCPRPLLPCIPMYIAVVALQHGLAVAGAPRVVSLAAQVIAGALVYIASAFALCRPGVDELLRIGRDAIRGRRSKA